jgi:hypothetical protein
MAHIPYLHERAGKRVAEGGAAVKPRPKGEAPPNSQTLMETEEKDGVEPVEPPVVGALVGLVETTGAPEPAEGGVGAGALDVGAAPVKSLVAGALWVVVADVSASVSVARPPDWRYFFTTCSAGI